MDHSEVKHLPKVDHTPAELDNASKLLLKAANMIEKHGWCQGEQEKDGRLCALGALHYADWSEPYTEFRTFDAREARRRLQDAVGTWRIGSDWNDHPDRTKDEVVSKLRAVALGG